MGRGFGATLDRLVAQRGRRPPRRDAPALPPTGRAPGRPGLAAGHLRHRHARGRRQHPDPHRADDRADEVRRQPRQALHGARVPPARRARRAARVRPRWPRVGASPRARHRERQGALPCGRRSQGPPQGDQGQATRGLRALRRIDHGPARRGHARGAHVAVPGDGRPRRQRAVATRRPGRPQGPPAHEPRPRATAAPAPPAGDRRLPQPRGGGCRRAAARCRRPLRRRARRVARRGRGRTHGAAVLVAADDVRHRGGRDVRPGRSDLRRRRRQRRRVGARGSPPGPATPSRTPPRRPRSPASRPSSSRTRSAWNGSTRSRGRSRWPSCWRRRSRRTGLTTRG